MTLPVARWIPVVGGTTLLILGTIGSVCSIAIFSHSTLRKCPYAHYMLVAAIFNLTTLDYPLLLRILADGWNIDWVSVNNVSCKLRFFIGYINSFVPVTMICLAAFDRWAFTSRSVRLRQLSSLRIAHYSIVITVIFWTLTSIPNLVYHQIVDGICRQTSSLFNMYATCFLNPVLYCTMPMIVVVVFGYGAYKNIQQVTNRPGHRRKKIDEQLTRVVILQCCSFIISQVPFTVWTVYATSTANVWKSPERLGIEAICVQISRLCFYLNYSNIFYINLAASKHVRSLVISFLMQTPFFLRKNRVHAQHDTPQRTPPPFVHVVSSQNARVS